MNGGNIKMTGCGGSTCLMTAAKERLTLFNMSSQNRKFSSPARSWLGMTAMYLNLIDVFGNARSVSDEISWIYANVVICLPQGSGDLVHTYKLVH